MMMKTLITAILLTASGVFASLEVMISHITAQCKSVGAQDKTGEVITAYINYKQCLNEVIDAENLASTIVFANQNRVFEEIASRVCSKKTELKSCNNIWLDAVSPCDDSTSRTPAEKISTKQNMAKLIDHACDTLSEFTAANGFECVMDKIESLQGCINENIVGSPDHIATLSSNEQCVLFDKISKCALPKLAACGPVVYRIEETFSRDLRAMMACSNSPTSTVTSLPLLW